MDYTVISERGRVRDKNEDNYLALANQQLEIFVVADGMGGHESGEIASALAIETVQSYEFKPHNLNKDIKEVIELANQKIYNKNKELGSKMGTTLTIAIVKKDSVKIGHVGDSRAYLYNSNYLEQLTKDHSYVAELLRKDLITEQEAQNHPKRNLLLNALGTEKEVEIDIVEKELKTGDLLLLCSDGLSNMLTKVQISGVLTEQADLDKKAEELVKMANQNGGYDNITVLVYQY